MGSIKAFNLAQPTYKESRLNKEFINKTKE